VFAVAVAVAVLYATGWRPTGAAFSLGGVRAAWTNGPARLFLAAWLLIVVAVATPAPARAVPLATAGALLVHGGTRLVRNTNNWADAFAQHQWIDQGFPPPNPTGYARVVGAGWILIGGAFLLIAVVVAYQAVTV